MPTSTPSDRSLISSLSSADLTPRQQAAIDALYEKNCLLIAPKGLGKTVVGQTAIQELIRDGVITRCLVIAPLKVCQLSWANESLKWAHLEHVGLALGNEAQRRATLQGPCDIVVVNFDNLAWLVKSGLYERFDGLLVDECTKLKGGGAGFKALRKVLKHFTWRSAMTADAIPEMGTDIFYQAMLCDVGAALGRNKALFTRAYFYPTDFQQRKWKVLPGRDKALADALAPILTVITDDEYEAGLPLLHDTVVFADMPPVGWGAYNGIEDDGFLDLGAGVLAETAAAVQQKKQQVTAGAVYDLKSRAQWIHTAKFDALDRLLQRLDRPVAVAYWFTFELEELKRRYPFMRVLGEDSEAVEAAWTAGEFAIMAVHPASCSHGLNLQYGGHDLIILTPPWSADLWEQLVGRFRRRGQPSLVVNRTVIMVADTVDGEVMARHREKRYDSESLNATLADA